MDILKKRFYTNIDKAITIRSKNQKVYKEEDLLEIKNELTYILYIIAIFNQIINYIEFL
jgi:hypothetical protein